MEKGEGAGRVRDQRMWTRHTLEHTRSMADSVSSPKAGNKRPPDSKAEEKRPPKVRRFDVKVRVPKAQTGDRDTNPQCSNTVVEKRSTGDREKGVVVTTVFVQSNGAKSKTKSGGVDSLRTQAETSAEEVPQKQESAEQASHGDHSEGSGKGEEVLPADSAPEAMSVSRMFQTSLELQQAEMGSGQKEERAPSHRRNIVDQLFQDFMTTKMREVDETAKDLPEEDNLCDGESEQAQVSSSMEEINRLLDAEITSIKSRSVEAGLTQEGVFVSKNDSDKTQGRSSENSENTFAVDLSDAPSANVLLESGHISTQLHSVVDVFADDADTAAVKDVDSGGGLGEVSGPSGGEVKGLLVRKKPETKKLGLSIGAESLARIMGNWKNGHILEEGEVASSTDSDGDKAFRVNQPAEEEEPSNDSDEVSGTGSLSDSDHGKGGGKSKKKKKHKHKHKKKKKHKAQSKEKERKTEEKVLDSVERKSSKERRERKSSREKSDRKSSKERKEKEKVPAKEAHEIKHKDTKSGHHHKSKSPEPFDPWDARSYRTDGPSPRSRSPHGSGSKSRHGDRSSSKSKDRPRDRSKDRARGSSKEKHRSKHKSSSRERSDRKHSSRAKDDEKRASDKKADADKDQSDLRVKIDKNKLRKIAITRYLANYEKGKGPNVDLTIAKSGGKSVAELTEFCKQISQREKDQGEQSSDSDLSLDEEEGGKSEGEDGPLHHPFIMRDPSSLPNIVMNIRNAKQLPVLTPQEKQTQAATLRTQFPVSSGTHHRNKESEWVPVTTTTTTTTTTHKATTTPANSLALVPAVTSGTVTSGTVTSGTVTSGSGVGIGGGAQGAVPLPAPTAVVPAQDSVFPSQPDIDIGAIISERIQAMRRLEQNPFDSQALNSVHRINEQAHAWAQSKHLPGQFTGTTDVRILTQEELAGPDKRNQAWAKKDQFRKAPPVRGGIGMFLLQKMGWKPGDGLGKDNEGNKEPLMLDIKMDRKGLSTSQDHRPPTPMLRPPFPAPFPGQGPRPPLLMTPSGAPHGPGMGPVPGLGPAPGPGPGPGLAPPLPPPQRAKDLSGGVTGKHPVSALTELCTKRRWGAPAFDLVSETGPAHKKMFLFKVRVNGVEYMPSAACGNKKLAKAQAAAVCLQEMGLIPRDFVVQV
ncbi:uncharacterized protein LOC143283167 isoform X2 [Babylonia areolata]|uniref:uncharacterized protein LOC143283167 isoform X2 n=1 Tax=Babylonia areolata TaxID=304850 RepID=UPI003FD593F1